MRFNASSLFQSAPPAFARGDKLPLTETERPNLFQSAPPAFARGDTHLNHFTVSRLCFNPRPPLSRGAINVRARFIVSNVVSIRAPRFREGR